MTHTRRDPAAVQPFGSETFFDAQPIPQATIEDLDLDRVLVHMEHARQQLSRFDAPDDPIAFLRSRTCLVDDTPTLAGMLVFGRYPQAILSYAGISLTHFYGGVVTTQVRHSDTLDGPLGQLITA